MKKTKKLWIVPLFLLLPLAGCSENGEQKDSQNGDLNSLPPATQTQSDNEVHHIDGTLHQVKSADDNGVPFIVNDTTDYRILHINDTAAKTAANYIATQIFNATGVNVENDTIAEGDAIPSSSKAIVIGSESSFVGAGFTHTSENLGQTGYEIKTKDNAVYLMGTGSDSYSAMAIRFLDLLLGFDLYYGNSISFSKDGSVLPQMDITERPDFDYRKIDDPDTSWRYGAGFTANDLFMTVGNIQFHNDFQYLPPETYGKDHPKWYSARTISEGCSSSSKGSTTGQLCYTAHGDEEELKLMEKTAADVLINTADKNPELSNITFTIEDNYFTCDCDTCKEVSSQYGGHFSSTALLFINDLDDIVQEHYQHIADETGKAKREIYISFFAYHAFENAPAVKENGVYKAINNIHTNPNVCVYIAPIDASFTHSFYEEENEVYADNIKAWSAVSDNVYFWGYETNFSNYLYPYNSFSATPETMRFLKENNAKMVYMENAHNSSARTGFNRLKLYIDAKIAFDVNSNVKEITDTFFDGYYGKASNPMRQFYEEMRVWTMQQEMAYPNISSGGIYDVINVASIWPKNLLERWEGLCEEALEAISSLATTNPDKYSEIRDAILVESIFPRYALLEIHSSSYTTTQLQEKRVKFKQDADALGFSKHSENGDLSEIYVSWGI